MSDSKKKKTEYSEGLTRAEKRAIKKEEKIKDKARIKAEKKEDREALFKVEDPIFFMRIVNAISIFLALVALFLGVFYVLGSKIPRK